MSFPEVPSPHGPPCSLEAGFSGSYPAALLRDQIPEKVKDPVPLGPGTFGPSWGAALSSLVDSLRWIRGDRLVGTTGFFLFDGVAPFPGHPVTVLGSPLL